MKSRLEALKEHSTLPIYWVGKIPYIYDGGGIYSYKITAHYNRVLKKYYFVKTRLK